MMHSCYLYFLLDVCLLVLLKRKIAKNKKKSPPTFTFIEFLVDYLDFNWNKNVFSLCVELKRAGSDIYSGFLHDPNVPQTPRQTWRPA